jgi:hypothetical protein
VKGPQGKTINPPGSSVVLWGRKNFDFCKVCSEEMRSFMKMEWRNEKRKEAADKSVKGRNESEALLMNNPAFR